MAQIPTPDFAVPYAAPKQVKTIAEVHPIAPKNGYIISQLDDFDIIAVDSRLECSKLDPEVGSLRTLTAYTGLDGILSAFVYNHSNNQLRSWIALLEGRSLSKAG